MPESKNLFIKSKMNKDLDDRLLPSGEYRDGQNIGVSKSEGSDVGALENVLGNSIIENTRQITNRDGDVIYDAQVIGYYRDTNTDRIYLFLTNFIDNSSDGLSNMQQGFSNSSSKFKPIFSAITCYTETTGDYRTLVEGSFLNFSKNSIITGINVLENLLFWTDDRNQPRKINVSKAFSSLNFYINEDQISVAKYFPYNPPRLWADEVCGSATVPQAQMKNKTSKGNPINYGESEFDSQGNPTHPNPTYDPTYTGDAAFLEDKFIRFSYRFKYDENEYSLMSPFTQVAFIPKQDGYFGLNLPQKYTGEGDGIDSTQEDETYKSTIVNWMENKVDSVNIFIDLPCPANELASKFLVSSIDILYKEANSLAVKVVKTIKVTDPLFVDAGSDTFINWEYQASKPIRTLPEDETIRVSDEAPVRALAQEIIGNRVVYGNYTRSYPWPKTLDYKVGVSEKAQTSNISKTYSRVEYPNHTLKQNRNYQVGIVLSDRYGRQTPAILTPPKVTEEIIENVVYKNSTIYHPYKSDSTTNEDILYWTGDSLKILFNGAIEVLGSKNKGLYDKEKNPLGWYSYKVVVKQQEQDYYNVYLPGMLDGYLNYEPDSVINTISHAVLLNDNINKIPRDLKEVGPTQSTFGSSVRLWGRVNNIASPYIENSTVPFYSKLTDNQPYNSQYYPETSADQVVTISRLSEMGLGQFKTVTLSAYDQSQDVDSNTINVYVKELSSDVFANSTVRVSGPGPNTIPENSLVKNYRANPRYTEGNFDPDSTTAPIDPGSTDATMAAMFNIEAEEYNWQIDGGSALTFSNATFYNANSNPYIVRMSTKKGLGSYVTPGPDKSIIVLPELSVLETTPTISALDIYWETSTAGLISDLNDLINSPLGARDFGEEWRFIGDEGNTSTDNLLSSEVWAVNQIGQQVPGIIDVANSYVEYPLTSTTTQTYSIGNTPNDFFQLIASGVFPYYKYMLRLNPNKYWVFNEDYATSPFRGDLTFIFRFVPDASLLPANAANPVFLQEFGSVSNVKPQITLPSFEDVPSEIAYRWAGIIYGVNGSADASREREQLIMEITSQVNIDAPFTQVFQPNSNPQVPGFFLELVTNSSGVVQPGQWRLSVRPEMPSGTYTLILTLTDANGFGSVDTAIVQVTLKEPGLSGHLTWGSAQVPVNGGYFGWFTKTTIGVDGDKSSNSILSSVGYTTGQAGGYLANGSCEPIPLLADRISKSNETLGRVPMTGKANQPAYVERPAPLGTWIQNNNGIADFVATFEGAYGYSNVNGLGWQDGQFNSGYDDDIGVPVNFSSTFTNSQNSTDPNNVQMGNISWYYANPGGSQAKYMWSSWPSVKPVNYRGSVRPDGSINANFGYARWWKDGGGFLSGFANKPLTGNTSNGISKPGGGGNFSKHCVILSDSTSVTVQPPVDANPVYQWAPPPISTSWGSGLGEDFNKACSGAIGQPLGYPWRHKNSNYGAANHWIDLVPYNVNQFAGNNFLMTGVRSFQGLQPQNLPHNNNYEGSSGSANKIWYAFFGNNIDNTDEMDGGYNPKSLNVGGSSFWGSSSTAFRKWDAIYFRTRVNKRKGADSTGEVMPGIKTGTALIRIGLDYFNYDRNSTRALNPLNSNILQDCVMMTNISIQYRPNEDSPWEEALDIDDQPLMAGIWDTDPSGVGKFGYGTCLLFRGATKARDNAWAAPIPEDGSGTDTNGSIETERPGLIDPRTYNNVSIAGGHVKRAKATNIAKPKMWTTPDLEFDAKGATSSQSVMPGGHILRNLSVSSSKVSNYSEVSFAVKKKGDYRIVIDNMRPNLAEIPHGNSATYNFDGARPRLVALQGQVAKNGDTVVIGPGMCINVMDMYNERPISGFWGPDSPYDNLYEEPSGPPLGPFNGDNLTPVGTQSGNSNIIDVNKNTVSYQNRIGSDITWYAYTVNDDGFNSREEALSGFDPRAIPYDYLFAKEPAFRYVSCFYTRVKNPDGTYIYSKWYGNTTTSADSSFYPMTARFQCSSKNNGIANNQQAITQFLFPEEAGVPFVHEKAYGQTRQWPTSGDGGVYHTWTIQIQKNTGKVLSQPVPYSYVDTNPSAPSWYQKVLGDGTVGPSGDWWWNGKFYASKGNQTPQ